MKPRRNFAESFADAIRISAAKRKWRAFIPHVFLSCLGAGFAASWSIDAAFWTQNNWDVSATVFGGLLAFNALLLAVGWSAFSKIYEVISGGRIGKILTGRGLLDEHLFFVDANHAVLVASAFMSGLGLFSILWPLHPIADRTILAIAVGSSIYALIRSLSCTTMMHQLIWEQAHIEDVGRPPLSAIDGGARDNSQPSVK